jgi:hypothetical protein
MSGPHDFAVRITTIRLMARCGHRFPASRIVTIGRNVPLAEAGWRHQITNSDKAKVEILGRAGTLFGSH